MRFELTDLVVSALRSMPEHKSLTTNWSAMLRALQSETTRRKSINLRLDTVRQRVLLRMFVAAAKMEVSDVVANASAEILDPDLVLAMQASQDSLVTTTKAGTKNTKKKQKENLSSHEELTLALLRSLPDLLQRFKSETTVLESLTTLPGYFCKCLYFMV